MKYQEIKAHSSYVNSIIFDPDRQSFFSLGFNGELREWDMHSLKLLSQLTGHSKTINGLYIFQNKLITVSGDGYIRVWDIDSKKSIKHILLDRRGILSLFGIGKEEVWVSTGSNKLILVDLSSLEVVHSVALQARNQRILDINPSESILAIGGLGSSIKFYHYHTGKLIKELEDAHDTAVCGIKFIDEDTFISLGYLGDLSTWDIKKEKEIDGKLLDGNSFYSMALNKERHMLAISCAFNVYILDSNSLSIINQFKTSNKGNYGLSFSPAGDLLALGSSDKKIRIWNLSLSD